MRNGVTEQELIEKAKITGGERVTLESIEAAIVWENYFTADEGVSGAELHNRLATQTEPFAVNHKWHQEVYNPGSLGLLTICVLTLTNGWTILGKSACADPLNFNPDLGRRLARTDAVNQIWPLMGFELRSRVHQKEEMERACRPERQGAPATANAEGAGKASAPREDQKKEETWLERLMVETAEITSRFKKLDAYLMSPAFNQLSTIDRRDLRNQHYHMEGYRSVLERRLARHASED